MKANVKSISSLAGFPQVTPKMPKELISNYSQGTANDPHGEVLTLEGFRITPKYGTDDPKAGEVASLINNSPDATEAFNALNSGQKETLVKSCRERAVLKTQDGVEFEFQAAPFTGFEGGNTIQLFGYVDTYDTENKNIGNNGVVEFVRPTNAQAVE